MRRLWVGYVAGVLTAVLVVSSCHPFPCRTGTVGGSVYMVCK